MRTILVATLALLLALSSWNCASIAHGTTQRIGITSDPSGANVTLKCLEGSLDASKPTPNSIEIKRNKVSCQILVSKEGFRSESIQLERSMSGWYIGNILIGGIIGFIVDAADGAMFNQSPTNCSAIRVSAYAQDAPACTWKSGGIQLSLKSEAPK